MSNPEYPSRRRFLLTGAFAASGLAVTFDAGLAQPQAIPTPACDGGLTLRQTEGPFYTPSSPERVELIESGGKGRVVELTGHVLTPACRPLPRALVDLWHADENGHYDNSGFRYRGHVFTDAGGRFRFRTVEPARYPGRTRHYHVKVRAKDRPEVLTTQLYFPDEPGNRRDPLFRRELLMQVANAGDGLAARFDFVLDIG